MTPAMRQAVDALKAVHDTLEDDSREDATCKAIRFACRMGMDAASGASAPSKELASFGEPGKRTERWLLRYEDTEVGDCVYDANLYGSAEAELLARHQYEQSQVQWNCTLYRVASLDPRRDACDMARVDELEATIREMRAMIARTEPGPAMAHALVKADLALGTIDPAKTSFERVATLLRAKHAQHLRVVSAERAKLIQNMERDKSWRERVSLSDDDRDLYERVDQDERENLAVLSRNLEIAERVDAAWKAGGVELLLPIGTTVRVRPFTQLPSDWPLPVEGTIGVVTGYSDGKSQPNVVSFLGEVKVTGEDGEAWFGDHDSAVRFNYLADDLDVVSNGTVMDSGVPVTEPGWTATHGHGEKGDILYTESMVVAANGTLWRTQPCSGPPECTQMTTHDGEGRKTFNHLIPLKGE